VTRAKDTTSLERRFWSKVDRSGGPDACWPWTAARFGPESYGAFWKAGKGTNEGAHRRAWEAANGPIPDDLCVLHRCDNRPCCNPAHLFLGTYLDNVRDMIAKGRDSRGDDHWARKHPERVARGDRVGARRHPERYPRGDRHPARLHPECLARGERAGSAKLTESDVIAIRTRSAAGELGCVLAREFGISRGAVSRIVLRKTWKHVP